MNIAFNEMATESPIKMMVSRGKWSSHPGTASYTSSPVNIAMDEDGLLVESRYQTERCNAPNRSGSAPPSMEGSLAAWESLVHSSSSAAICSSNVNTCHNRRSFSFIDGCNNSRNLSWGILPTHKEESEDDMSPHHVFNERTLSGQDLSSSGTRSRSLVDQTRGPKLLEDLPCAPSPVSDQQHFSCPGPAEVADNNADYNSLPDQPIGVLNMVASNLHAQEADFSDATASGSMSHVSIERTLPLGDGDDRSGIDSHLEKKAMLNGAPEIASLQSGIEALKITPLPNIDIHSSQEERQPICQDGFLQDRAYQQNNIFQFQNITPQIVSQGVNNAYIDMNHTSHLGKLSSVEMQPVFQSSGSTSPSYAGPNAYLPSANPYYSGMQSPGVIYPAQYGLGGYGFNPMVFSPYLSGYPPHSAVPFNGASSPQYSPRASGVPSAAVDTQNLSKFYGQFGLVQHPFADPHMQFPLPYGDFYNAAGQVDPSALRSGFFRGQGTAFNSLKRPDFSGVSTDHKAQNQGTVGTANINQRRGAVATPNYFRSSTNVGVLQIPTSALPSPLLPSSPISGTNLPNGTNALSFPYDNSRNVSFCAGWPAQTGYASVNCTNTYSVLEELKSGKGRRLEIADIAGHVVEFSVDQHGSRFIQQKLENCNTEEKASVFKEVLPHASKLMIDVFGNYVIQKFFEYGTTEQRKELADQLRAQVLPLSMQMYGCRVIQKALEVIELDQKAELVHELDGHVPRCVRDQNGNHVIQKCIESIPIENIDFIISAFRGQVATLSMHPYGCRVIQRVLEHCTDGSQSQFIVDEILESVCTLAQNQYGNYVTQHVLEKGNPEERIQIIRKLAGQVLKMSQHKFASNVIEKCLEYSDTEGRELLIDEIIGTNESNDNLLIMMKDQYANYVVQKILETCTDTKRDLLLGRIRVHLNALRKYTYGKHIVARFEQLFGEEIQASGS